MQQLTFKDLVKLFDDLKEKYSVEEIMKMPINIYQFYTDDYSNIENCFEKDKEIFIG